MAWTRTRLKRAKGKIESTGATLTSSNFNNYPGAFKFTDLTTINLNSSNWTANTSFNTSGISSWNKDSGTTT